MDLHSGCRVIAGFGCSSSGARPPVVLPVPKTGEVTLYLSMRTLLDDAVPMPARLTSGGAR
jgi:hypothetical protein